jgi:Na+-transporting NADH:ubiquinone oxidoreductase subunit NqrC
MIITILVSLVCGFVAGVLGSIITRDITEHQIQQKTIEDAQQYAVINNRIENINSQYKAVTVALEQLTYKFIRERGAVWESLNGLWNDYDDRHKEPEQAEAEPAPEATETGNKRAKKSRREKNTDEGKNTVQHG